MILEIFLEILEILKKYPNSELLNMDHTYHILEK